MSSLTKREPCHRPRRRDRAPFATGAGQKEKQNFLPASCFKGELLDEKKRRTTKKKKDSSLKKRGRVRTLFLH